MNKNILLLLWHPRESMAGGFVRIQEFIPYFNEFYTTVIDNTPSCVEKELKNGKIIPYTIPNIILSIYSINFILARLCEWIYVTIILMYYGTRELHKNSDQIIYGTTGENFHIFLPCVLLKIFYPKTRLVLDILNFEFPSNITNFIRENKQAGIVRIIISTIEVSVTLFIERALIKNADHIVTVSKHLKHVIAKYYPEEKISVTPSGVSITNKQRNKENKKIYDAIYVGRMTYEKGIFDVIKVWELFCKRKRTAKLVLVGYCDASLFKTLQSEIIKRRLQKNVIITGLVSEEKKQTLLQESAVFLHLAYAEPLVPVITILEALSFGLPVVTYDTKAFKDYPELYKNPALAIVENRNILKAFDATQKFYGMSKAEKKNIKDKAMQLANQFDWKEIVKIELSVFNKLAQE